MFRLFIVLLVPQLICSIEGVDDDILQQHMGDERGHSYPKMKLCTANLTMPRDRPSHHINEDETYDVITEEKPVVQSSRPNILLVISDQQVNNK